MKIRTQFFINMFLFGFILLMIAVSLIVTNRQVNRMLQQEEIAHNIEHAARELSYLSNDYLLHRESQQRERWELKFASLSEYVNSLQLNNPDQQVLADQMKVNLDRLESVFSNVVTAKDSISDTQNPANQMAFIRVSWSRIEVQNQGIIFDSTLLAHGIRDQIDQLKQMYTVLIFVLVGLFGVYLFSNYWLIYRRTLKSLADLQTGTHIIGSGNLSYLIDDHRSDEIGELSRAFNQMTTNLREITASKADLEREIAERKQVEEALGQSEARLRRLVEANLIGVVTRTEAGQIKDANDAFLNLIGFSLADIQNGDLNIYGLVPEEYTALEKQVIDEVLTRGSSKSYESEIIRKNRQRVPVLVGYTRLEGPTTDLIGFVLDMTELKQAQATLADYADKLKRSNQELEQFAFIASHDLQEPLRKIRGFGSRLVKHLDGKLDPEPLEFLTRMQNAAERMQTMIDDLLELSRVSTRSEQFEIVDLNEVAEEVVSDLEPRIQAVNGRVYCEPLPVIEADPQQMRQLLQNLISNAIKYHKPNDPPVVKVSGRVDQRRPGMVQVLTILVEDNGIGFDELYLDRIFQPFQRLHGRNEYEGTGIGLSICKKIVDRHHGTITACSQPGEGSSFMASFPVKQKN